MHLSRWLFLINVLNVFTGLKLTISLFTKSIPLSEIYFFCTKDKLFLSFSMRYPEVEAIIMNLAKQNVLDWSQRS